MWDDYSCLKDVRHNVTSPPRCRVSFPFMRLRDGGDLAPWICPLLSIFAVESVSWAAIGSCLDYCNCLLTALPTFHYAAFQFILSIADKVLFLNSKSHHVTPLLKVLWLPKSLFWFIRPFTIWPSLSVQSYNSPYPGHTEAEGLFFLTTPLPPCLWSSFWSPSRVRYSPLHSKGILSWLFFLHLSHCPEIASCLFLPLFCKSDESSIWVCLVHLVSLALSMERRQPDMAKRGNDSVFQFCLLLLLSQVKGKMLIYPQCLFLGIAPHLSCTSGFSLWKMAQRTEWKVRSWFSLVVLSVGNISVGDHV